jgi:histidine ammonia-lyase
MLAHPASVDSIPTDGNKEDVVPMAMHAAIKLRRAVRNLRNVLAIELLIAAEALEYRRPLRSSTAVERAHGIVRDHVARADGDRSPSPDIARLAEAVASGAFDNICAPILETPTRGMIA